MSLSRKYVLHAKITFVFRETKIICVTCFVGVAIVFCVLQKVLGPFKGFMFIIYVYTTIIHILVFK